MSARESVGRSGSRMPEVEEIEKRKVTKSRKEREDKVASSMAPKKVRKVENTPAKKKFKRTFKDPVEMSSEVLQLKDLADSLSFDNYVRDKSTHTLAELKKLRDTSLLIVEEVCRAIDREGLEVRKVELNDLESRMGMYNGALVDLEKEKEKNMCQICFTKPRNAIVMTCMHFQFCHDCLHEHKQKSGRCPTCRGKMSGVCELNL